MSVAVMESTKVLASILMFCEVEMACFTPTTTTSSAGVYASASRPVSVLLPGVALPLACAICKFRDFFSGGVEAPGAAELGPALSPPAGLLPVLLLLLLEMLRMVAVFSLLYTASRPVPFSMASRAACFSRSPAMGLAVARLTWSY
jgi:hypothetical protein